ncbi:MAG: hypothetical protein KME21_28635 [Desmonostoc vinosum HA7617-LM4]|jgi:hypothetical protein|nr:hypothetical protein [Desmonostoc vinosum HA7617-LM4]
MSFFNYSKPPLRRKQPIVAIPELEGLLYINWHIGKITLYSTFYTRIDQACILWSLLIITMFITAQFVSVSWSLQATLWSILSCIGIVAMVTWSWDWVKLKHISWVLYCWIVLMLFGLILTNLSIFIGWGEILPYLCPLWLGLSTLGYLCTGLALRSRALILTGIFHLLGILILPYIGAWQFLTTGIVMVVCLLVLAEFQWDCV